ncbi:MAG: hypothetical protein RBT46_04580 [Weeksellaceae bacterium]|jgi:hypothetical protein|nr:hypothetical protein [Weeksellaceae bacterium]MDX9704968.1 hypothetical protein [Weeksellaceae bacterium]
MKKLFFLIHILFSTVLFSQEYFYTTTNTNFLNKTIRNTGRIILGYDFDAAAKLQVYENSATTTMALIGNNKGRMELIVASASGHGNPWAQQGDAIIRNLGGSKNLHFHMPNTNFTDPNSDTSTPNSPGITRIRFSDLTNKSTLVLFNTGKVTIGTDQYDNSDYRLFVKDGIKTEKIKVELASTNGWADYVFHDDYELMPLHEVESYIIENKHLPNMPSAEEIVAEGGFELKEMNVKLLEKIEELTLYIIEQNKRIELLEKRLNEK